MAYGVQIQTTNGSLDITETRAARLVAIRRIYAATPATHSQVVSEYSETTGFIAWITLTGYAATWNEATKTFTMDAGFGSGSSPFEPTSLWVAFMRYG